jgi:CheY-like chemotaxis protein
MVELLSQKILVVDDESDVSTLVAYHLKAKGYQIAVVNDPNRSIGVARTFLPDLVILDVMMPQLNGIQICRMLRADPQLKKVPVIFLTAKHILYEFIAEVFGHAHLTTRLCCRELLWTQTCRLAPLKSLLLRETRIFKVS